MKGIYLVKPYGSLIYSGDKTHIVKKRIFTKMINIPLVLIEDKRALGIILLKEPKKINKKEFIETYDLHRIPIEDAEKWWGDFDVLFLYPLRIIKLFDSPIPVDVPKGVQTFISDVKIPELEKEAKKDDDIKTIIKEIMDYGEWEHYLEGLTKFIKSAMIKNKNYPETMIKNKIYPGTIAIDADGTIFDVATFPLVGRVKPGAKKAIDRIRMMGFKVVIWSSRNNNCWNLPALRELAIRLLKIALDINRIRYDIIDTGNCGKWVADFYIDDRGIEFENNWEEVVYKIKQKLLRR